MQGDQEGIDNPSVYRSKFGFLSKTRRFFATPFLKKLVLTFHPAVNARDRYNLTRGRFTRLRDPIGNRYNPFHLVQRIPRRFLLDECNPYRTLVPPA